MVKQWKKWTLSDVVPGDILALSCSEIGADKCPPDTIVVGRVEISSDALEDVPLPVVATRKKGMWTHWVDIDVVLPTGAVGTIGGNSDNDIIGLPSKAWTYMAFRVRPVQSGGCVC